MASPIWNLREIENMGRRGWFYGLVRNHETGKIEICEIYPGFGYASAWPIYERLDERGVTTIPQTLWWIVKDILWAIRARKRFLDSKNL